MVLVVWGPMLEMNFCTLFAKSVDEVDERREFMSVYPMHFTPLGVT